MKKLIVFIKRLIVFILALLSIPFFIIGFIYSFSKQAFIDGVVCEEDLRKKFF